jgi:hypothetical protein
MFTSTVGTNILLVALSVMFFERHQSSMAAAGVYVAQFTPIILLMPAAWWLCDRLEPRRNLPLLEGLSMLATLLVGFSVAYAPPFITYALLFVRGFFDMTTKAARNVALKTFADDKGVAKANSVVTAASYLGQAAGAIVGFLLIGRAGIVAIAMVDAASYALSGLICLKLPVAQAIKSASVGYAAMLRRGRRALVSNPEGLQAFWILIAAVIFLQGYNQVARLWIPLAWLKLPANGGAISEAIGVAGIVAGLVLAATWLSGSKTWQRNLLLSYVLSSVLMFLPFQTTNIYGSFAFYFLFMTCFETAFMIAMNNLLESTEKADVPCIMVLFYGLAFGGMTVSVVLLGLSTDVWGLPAVAIVLCGLAILAIMPTLKLTKQLRGKPEGD